MLILQKGWIAPRLMLYLMGRLLMFAQKEAWWSKNQIICFEPNKSSMFHFSRITFIASFKDIPHIGQIINITLFFV